MASSAWLHRPHLSLTPLTEPSFKLRIEPSFKPRIEPSLTPLTELSFTPLIELSLTPRLACYGSPPRRSGEAKGIPADIRASQPTIFCSVPRVLERFETTVMDKASWHVRAVCAGGDEPVPTEQAPAQGI